MITIAKNIILWIARIILCVGFLFFGIMKFVTSPADAAEIFANIGGTAAQYFTGVYEIIAAILVIIPATAAIGAVLIAVSMIVAIILHVTVIGTDGMIVVAIVFAAISGFVAWKMKSSLPGMKK